MLTSRGGVIPLETRQFDDMTVPVAFDLQKERKCQRGDADTIHVPLLLVHLLLLSLDVTVS